MSSRSKTPFAAKTTVRKGRIPVRVTPEEDAQIRTAAGIRHLDVAEYMRRAALGRRADVAYDVEIVLALSDITRVIRGMHAALVEQGVRPPEEEMLALIRDARAAMLRIER
jgi:uncharacterized protein (DUF1778 family)